MKNKRLIIILLAVPALLLIPLIAMQFNTGVNWDLFDFIVMGILLSVTGFICELVIRKTNGLARRVIFCGIVLFAFFLIWAELAVGVFGTPFAGS